MLGAREATMKNDGTSPSFPLVVCNTEKQNTIVERSWPSELFQDIGSGPIGRVVCFPQIPHNRQSCINIPCGSCLYKSHSLDDRVRCFSQYRQVRRREL